VASEATLREIDLSVRDIVDEAFDEARAILTRRRADLDQGAELLLKKRPYGGGFSGSPAGQTGWETPRRASGFKLIFRGHEGFR